MAEGITLSRALCLGAMNLIELFGVHLLLSTFFEFREKMEDKKKFYPLTLVMCFVLLNLCNMQGIVVLNTISTFSVLILPALIFMKLKNLRGFIYYVFLYLSSIVSELLVVASINVIPDKITDYSIFDSPFVFLMTALLKFVFIILVCSFGKKETRPLNSKVLWIFLLVPVASLSMYYFCIMGRFLSEKVFANVGGITGFLLLVANIGLFIGLERFTKATNEAHEFKEQALKYEAESDILEVAAKSMKEQLAVSERMMEKDRMMRHDRRHFEGLILSLLQDGKTDEARSLLEERLNAEPKRVRRWCDNTSVNATLDYYIKKANNFDITVNVEANIPDKLMVDELDLSIAIGNLLENAINGCKDLSEGKRFINVSAKFKSQLLLEIENSCDDGAVFDESGYPITDKKGHGIGTKSVLAFVDKTNSQIFYSCKDGKFNVRMIIGE